MPITAHLVVRTRDTDADRRIARRGVPRIVCRWADGAAAGARFRFGSWRIHRRTDETEQMGAVERELCDRAAEALAEIEHLDVRPMFSGFGFYLDGILVAAALDGAFRLRYRESKRWIYRAVDESAIDVPEILVSLVHQRAQALAEEPVARPRHSRAPGRRRGDRAAGP